MSAGVLPIAGEPPLPELRDDLSLLPAAPSPDGSPNWTLFDPVRNRYFRIGWIAFELLTRWSAGARRRVLAEVQQETTCPLQEGDLDALIGFLHANSLTKAPPGGDSRAYAEQSRAKESFRFASAMQEFLFLKIPLFKPDAFLTRTLPLARPFTGRAGLRSAVVLGALGLFLISRQWDAFVSTFLHFFTWSGLAIYLVAQAGVKVVHELGHAYTAKRYGCRVPTMGVAFMLMLPVLYTDTSDAWRLRSRRERFHIAAAGILAELWLAALASFLWVWLPDGPLRSVAFVVATTSWILTLVVNLNPFMRFDGYYLLADGLGIENLQTRSFAWGRFHLRRWLFGLDEWAPSPDGPARRRLLTAYAFGTWIYRVFLFLGIALLVYHFVVKVLGVLLFAVEIVWFLGRPIVNEFQDWWSRREAIREAGRWPFTAGALGLLLLLALVPWNRSVALPAVLEPANSVWVFAPESSRIAEVHVENGDHVQPGDLLFTLELPALDAQRREAEKQARLLEVRSRRMAVHAEDRQARHILIEQLAENAQVRDGIEVRRARLVLRAPFAGRVSDVDRSLHPGRWIDDQLPLAFVGDPEHAEIRALAAEQEVGRIHVGRPARFFPDDLSRAPVDARVTDVSLADAPSFDQQVLASEFGGPVAVRRDPRTGALVPEDSVYPIRLDAPETKAPTQVVRGVVHIRGEARSLASAAFASAMSVWVRESGF